MVCLPRFLVFAGKKDTATGGWHNFKGEFHTEQEVSDFVATLSSDGVDWWHVVDLLHRQICGGDIT